MREKLQLEKNVLGAVIERLKKGKRIVEAKGRVATSEHRAAFREEDVRHIETIESLFRGQAFCPPGSDELCQETGADDQTIQRILKILREHEKLVQVAPGMLFHRESVDRARELLQQFIGQEGKLESVRFKYLLETTRKYALPLLDYFDRVGVTRRVGNTRYLKTPPLLNKRVRGWLTPPPPRYRNEVNSSYLPACGFPAPGGPAEIAPKGEPKTILLPESLVNRSAKASPYS